VRVGSAKLVVGGTDQALCRKASFSLSPGRVTASALDQLVGLSRETYNAAWQHRRDAWARARVSVGRFDQFDEIPEIRAVRPDVVRFGNQVGGVDRGITVTAALSYGTTISLPGFLKEARGVIAERQRAREQTERFSPAGRKHSRAIAQVSAKAHRQSENWARHTAKDIVAA